jgi:hypothetical protein
MEANSVTILDEDGSVTVRVVENGIVSEQVFAHLDFAESWASGQRLRLNVTDTDLATAAE